MSGEALAAGDINCSMLAASALPLTSYRTVIYQAILIGQRHLFQNNSPKRKRGNELGTIPRLRFGLKKRWVSAKTRAVELWQAGDLPACWLHYLPC